MEIEEIKVRRAGRFNKKAKQFFTGKMEGITLFWQADCSYNIIKT